jgi:hypothetical protein
MLSKHMENILNRHNIGNVISDYEASIEQIGRTLNGLKGIELFQYIKRNQLNMGPYPHVALFEAANRIMTDLVILKGVKWLLETGIFPFNEYQVEYGHEDKNYHDIVAMEKGTIFHGEAFNVAHSFFQVKKNAALRKLRYSKEKADFLHILANADAVNESCNPKLRENEYFVFDDIVSGNARVLPKKPVQSTPKSDTADGQS